MTAATLNPRLQEIVDDFASLGGKDRLQLLLGYPHVRNYDGSWTEWGNSVRAPIARGANP